MEFLMTIINSDVWSWIAITAAISATIMVYMAHRTCLLAMDMLFSSRLSRIEASLSSNQDKQNLCDELPKS